MIYIYIDNIKRKTQNGVQNASRHYSIVCCTSQNKNKYNNLIYIRQKIFCSYFPVILIFAFSSDDISILSD